MFPTHLQAGLDRIRSGLEDLYRELHTHPELSFAEHRTAALVAGRLRGLRGWEVVEGVGGTGVVARLDNGPGPVVMLRADMDALPVEERTGLPYASTVRATGPDGRTTPVAHACGHDMHVTCLLGALDLLDSDRAAWRGTVLAVFQPAEELGKGARAMVEDGLFRRFPKPDVLLAQHLAPAPAGWIGLSEGAALAASDGLRITLHGRGGHGSRPETTVDPVVMAAATVLRLQTIVSRTVAATEAAVVTVGAVHAGTAGNVIADRAELLLSVRSFTEPVRRRALDGIARIAEAEAAASAAPRPPEVEVQHSFPAVVNSPAAVARLREAFAAVFGAERLLDPGPQPGSEDASELVKAAGAACGYWFFGGSDPAAFVGRSLEEALAGLPSNHSPAFAPVIQPTLDTGVAAMVLGALAFLGAPD
ncbi:amidohydrolase [Kitasatospora sp. NPDC001664]